MRHWLDFENRSLTAEDDDDVVVYITKFMHLEDSEKDFCFVFKGRWLKRYNHKKSSVLPHLPMLS